MRKIYENYRCAGVILLDSNNRVLIVESRNKKGEKYSFPKGKREEYEHDSIKTAKRELNEETGITEEK